jgi:hypothetical protein
MQSPGCLERGRVVGFDVAAGLADRVQSSACVLALANIASNSLRDIFSRSGWNSPSCNPFSLPCLAITA